ncbi:MAG: YHS domain-containing protein [Epsilonproteobacteria bacterium]|nr:YHS domain-containing protein [Campylobacterota bacterium]
MNKSSAENKELKGVSSIKYRDPVCSMWVSPDDAKVTTNYNGEKYYFCSQSCIDKFNGSPEKYIKQSGNSQNMNMSSMKKHGRRRGGCC